MTRSAMLLTSLCMMAVPLTAQQPTHQPARHPGMAGMHDMQGMGMMDSMMGPMMQAMSGSPEHLLMQKDKLHLSTEQQARLTALRDEAKTAHDQAASQATMHLREMVTALHAAQPDTTTIRTHFAAAFRFMQAAHWTMVRAAAAAWPVLTAAQQHQVEADSASCCGGTTMGRMQH